MTTYDEDIKTNQFYTAIVENQLELLQRASSNGWIICIPRTGSIQQPIKDIDVFEHILIHESDNTFKTLNNTKILLEQHTITNKSNTVRILFKETFYFKDLKYQIYCIEHALNQELQSSEAPNVICNVRDCIDFLWIETLGRDILFKIGNECEIYINEHKELHLYELNELKDCAHVLFTKCLLLALKCAQLQEKTQRDLILLSNLKLSVETYMQHNLNNKIFNAVCAKVSHADANFNKIVRNLQEIQLRQMNLTDFQDCIAPARCELNKINRFVTTLGKLSCLKSTFKIFSDNKKSALTSEALLQLLAFVIIKLNICNWVGNLVYLQEFTFSTSASYDECSFLLTTFEAALEYVKSGALSEICCQINGKNALFESIHDSNLEIIKNSLQEVTKLSNQTLCHPLCSCDKCESLLLKKNEFTIYSCDEKGRNCLHLACIHGFPHIVDFFISKAVNNIADYSGSYPIHYAASKGHQNALLLLLHAGADINIANAEGNTALHLCANNGHENCVKALLYYSESKSNILNINCINSTGNTSLHYASKWGFLNIASLLLQHNIDFTIKNAQNQRALDLAGNYYIKTLLAKIQGEQIAETKAVYTHDFTYGSLEASTCFGVRPKNLDQFKKTDLLLKAIENNDLPLSCFYLDIPIPTGIKPMENCCHPLCNCEKCKHLENDQGTKINKNNLNINICNSDGWTPLHFAAKLGRQEIARLLLDAGANVNLQTYKSFYCPLHVACINQRVSVVKELCQSGSCNIDLKDCRGNTALFHACLKNNARIVEMLLSHGADVSVKNLCGKTVLQEAQDNSLFALAKIFKDKNTLACYHDNNNTKL